jgi:hypothetical protein
VAIIGIVIFFLHHWISVGVGKDVPMSCQQRVAGTLNIRHGRHSPIQVDIILKVQQLSISINISHHQL